MPATETLLKLFMDRNLDAMYVIEDSHTNSHSRISLRLKRDVGSEVVVLGAADPQPFEAVETSFHSS